MLLLVFVAAFTDRSEQTEVFGGIGDDVVLKLPTSPTSPITQIEWKHGDDLAVEWDGKATDTYLHFKERSDLNLATGELTLKNLTEELSGVYTVRINGNLLDRSITLKVIAPVPKPHITISCNEEKTECTLTCEGDVTAMDPYWYYWKYNGTEKKTEDNIYKITLLTSAKEFICEIENRVSRKSSEPISDPLTQVPEPEASNPKLIKALIVFGCLLAIVVGVAVFHRVKSGMWFHEKDSMPWEKDFWKKTESSAPSEPQPVNEEEERNSMMESNS